MYTLKKDNNIVLENGTYVLANALILLTSSKDNGFAVFLNDFDLIVYISKTSSIITLIDT